MTLTRRSGSPRRFPICIVHIITVVLLFLAAFGQSTGTVAQSTPVSDAPRPVTFPRDDGPHDQAIEWWYYTGHLVTGQDYRYGFEFVIFKAQVGGVTGYASHFAITDGATGTFRYDQRLGFAPADANLETGTGFDLQASDWSMRGAGGNDHLVATMAGFAIDLDVIAEKPPVLHDGDGYIDYGGGEGSYYYSRTRNAVTGTLSVDGVASPVTGEAWFDHQWGDFSTFSKGGWDWYSFQLDDGSELMLYVVRENDGRESIVDGSLIAPDGSLTVLERDDFTLTPAGTWTSPRSGAVYPSGWTIELPSADLTLMVAPVIPDQELDTSASTGVIYWEGEVTVTGTKGDTELTGLGYVELTGYAPDNEPLGTPSS